MSSPSQVEKESITRHQLVDCLCTLCENGVQDLITVDMCDVSLSQQNVRFDYGRVFVCDENSTRIPCDKSFQNITPTYDVGVTIFHASDTSGLLMEAASCRRYPDSFHLPAATVDAGSVTIELSPCERAYRRAQMNLLRAQDPSSHMPENERCEYLRIIFSETDPIGAIRQLYPLRNQKKAMRGFGG